MIRQMTSWIEQLLKDPHHVADKRSRIQKMFAAIAPSYDLNNRLHSLWMDQRWRRKAVKLAMLMPTDAVVDVACGTGDLALRFAKVQWTNAWKGSGGFWPPRILALKVPPKVIGLDFTFQMLPIARAKAKEVIYQLCSSEAHSEV